MDISTSRVIWYPQCPDKALRAAFLRQLQTLKRWALIDVWRDEVAGRPCYIITPEPHAAYTAGQQRALRDFQHWFNQHHR